ncbi:hypothetical protein JL09_g6251 [Pichia kudriavzevii]|uniref:Uncharacterized protein n=1 Tax=Pichia kudriavzevii TaxID=4909 RepID=A0A099NRS3_PICKU|nr:hypothetical protein JL09_g6251 [Pichia kudriavzevii]
MTDKLMSMLQQATLHAEKERTFGESIQESPQINQQEALLMGKRS